MPVSISGAFVLWTVFTNLVAMRAAFVWLLVFSIAWVSAEPCGGPNDCQGVENM